MSKLRDSDVRCFARQHSLPLDALMFKYKNKREELIEIIQLVERADEFKEEMFKMYAVPERFESAVKSTGYTVKEAILLLDDNGYTLSQVQAMNMTEMISAILKCSNDYEIQDCKLESDFDKMFDVTQADLSFLDEDDTYMGDFDDELDRGTYDFEDCGEHFID